MPRRLPGAVLGRLIRVQHPLALTPSRGWPSASLKEKGQGFDKLSPNGGGETRLSPSVRRACLQHGIDPSKIEGTGRNGRITREDVDRAVARATVTHAGEPATAQPRNFGDKDIPHDRMRLKIAENMARAVSRATPRNRRLRGGFLGRRGAQGSNGKTRTEAQLHRLYRQGSRRCDGGRAGDQRPLGRGSDRDFADDRHRRRDRARREGASRSGRQRRRELVARRDREAAGRPYPTRSRRESLPAPTFPEEASPSPTTAFQGRCSRLQSSSTRARPRFWG
jgi:hypothetical protein